MGYRGAIYVDESTIDFPIFLLFFNTKFPIFPIFSIPSFLFSNFFEQPSCWTPSLNQTDSLVQLVLIYTTDNRVVCSDRCLTNNLVILFSRQLPTVLELEKFNMANNSNNHFFRFTIPTTPNKAEVKSHFSLFSQTRLK